MNDPDEDRGAWTRLGDVLAARRARGGATPVDAPLPRGLGDAARGELMLAGRWCLAGAAAEGAPGTPPWRVPAPGEGFARAAHGFGWLADVLAAEGGAAAARGWTSAWIAAFGGGRGPGWSAGLAGRRAVAWVDAAVGMEMDDDPALARALGRHAAFLGRRAGAAPPGTGRAEAFGGLVRASLALGAPSGGAAEGLAAAAGPAREAAVGARDPEAAAGLLILLSGAVQALEAAERPVPSALRSAALSAAATVRALRHADGTLPRMHGGGRGRPEAIDAALGALRGPARAAPGPAAGYARLRAGRTTLILDGAAPPPGRAASAHASTLAIEVTTGRRPLIVSCGSGAAFGADWRRAGRATASHSALVLDGTSSARFAVVRGSERLVAGPVRARCAVVPEEGGRGARIQASHDGWRDGYGLTCGREVALLPGGAGIEGEDTLAAVDAADRERLARARAAAGARGLPFEIRFHLHSDVGVAPSPDGALMAPPSGELWELTHDEACELEIEESVHLGARRARPAHARQVVLRGRAASAVTRVRWRLAKADGTPAFVRDLEAVDGSV